MLIAREKPLMAYLALFKTLTDYSRRMESQLSEMRQFEELKADSAPTDHDYEVDHMIIRHEFEHELLPAFRQSFILILFSQFERQLYKFCDHLKREKGWDKSYEDMKGETIGRVNHYLRENLGIQLARFKSWPNVERLRIVRNVIAHANLDGKSKLTVDTKQLSRIAKESNGLIWIEPLQLLNLQPIYCQEQVINTRQLFVELFDHEKLQWLI